MVASQVELAEKIDDFVRRIRLAVAVDAVILFGSYAKGNADDSSDVDVAVVSPDFEGTSTWQRQDTIARATVGRGHRLAPVGFASSEYRSPDSTPFLREIIRTGRVVYEAPAE